jgi:integrase
MRSMGVDIKVAQTYLRHASSRLTMDLYTHVVSNQKREASNLLVEMLLAAPSEGAQHP